MNTNTDTGFEDAAGVVAVEDFEAAMTPLGALVRRLGGGAQGDAVRRIFGDLVRLVGHTARVDEMLLGGCAPEEALTVFAAVRAEGWSLVEFIRAQADGAEGMDESLRDALDGVTYALRHELRRAYDDELTGLETLRNPSSVRLQLARASDLLRNCFQQTAITLAQGFDPALDGCRLFDNYRDRLEQSLALSKGLWVLVQHARRALREHDCESVVAFVEALKRFRHGQMHHLMYRDWHVFEDHVARVLATRSTEELLPAVRDFSAYLETLLGHVRRRAVLLNHADDAG